MTTREISPAFPFESKFIGVEGSNMHYVEDGDGDPILFLHGQPTSSYLWRNIIPHLTGSGRCIAPDLIGFGKSDKPDLEYRFFDHVKYAEGFIAALDLRNITLVVHDWGSGLGFHYAMRNEPNIKGMVMMEAIVAPIPSWDDFPQDFQEMFRGFRTPDVGWDMLVNQNMFVEMVLPNAIVRDLTEEEMNVYRAPFLDPASRKPLWRWPNELPIAGEPADVADAVASYGAWLAQSDLPKLLFHGTPGAIMPPPVVEVCKATFPNLETVDIGPGLHYLQEDNPHLIGEKIAEWCTRL